MKIVLASLMLAFVVSGPLGCATKSEQPASTGSASSQKTEAPAVAEPTSENVPEKVFPDPDYMKCEAKNDCVIVDQDCGDCCDYKAINKKFQKQYASQKAAACKPVYMCDCMPTTQPRATCVKGKCEVR